MQSQAHSPDEAAVRATVADFYAAFEALDLAAMSRVWLRGADDICVHPGWEILEGWPAIRESWRAIFANTGFVRFQPSRLHVQVHGDVARVTGVENILSVSGSHTAHTQVAASKLLLRTEDGWRIALHHGSPIATRHSVQELPEDEPAN